MGNGKAPTESGWINLSLAEHAGAVVVTLERLVSLRKYLATHRARFLAEGVQHRVLDEYEETLDTIIALTPGVADLTEPQPGDLPTSLPILKVRPAS